MTVTPSTTQETIERAAGESESTPRHSPDPDYDRLRGDPVRYEANDALVVFSFDDIDSAELDGPLIGSGWQPQGITNSIVTGDGGRESAGTRIIQSFEGLSASGIDADTAAATQDQYTRSEIVSDQTVDGETGRVVGIVDSNPSYSQMCQPSGSAAHRQVCSLPKNRQTSIIRLNEDTERVPPCEALVNTAAETVGESLRPNPDTTVAEA